MSETTIKMCDVKNCRSEASTTYDTIVVAVADEGDEGGFDLVTYKNVDMCGPHSFNYRTSVSSLEIKNEIDHE